MRSITRVPALVSLLFPAQPLMIDHLPDVTNLLLAVTLRADVRVPARVLGKMFVIGYDVPARLFPGRPHGEKLQLDEFLFLSNF